MNARCMFCGQWLPVGYDSNLPVHYAHSVRCPGSETSGIIIESPSLPWGADWQTHND